MPFFKSPFESSSIEKPLSPTWVGHPIAPTYPIHPKSEVFTNEPSHEESIEFTKTVKIMGQEYEIVFADNPLFLADEMEEEGEDIFHISEDDKSVKYTPLGFCDSSDNKIYVFLNQVAIKLSSENKDEEDEVYFKKVSLKEIKRTVIHEMLHAVLLESGHDEMGVNERLIEIMDNMLYHLLEVDKSFETIFTELESWCQVEKKFHHAES